MGLMGSIGLITLISPIRPICPIPHEPAAYASTTLNDLRSNEARRIAFVLQRSAAVLSHSPVDVCQLPDFKRIQQMTDDK
ncbi:MAG: hypothetical protein JWM11_3220 [Planctomycetaceae bacterium]|nr:hypothetical protein [Planctomycetaceae bacterium]